MIQQVKVLAFKPGIRIQPWGGPTWWKERSSS